MKRPVPPNQLVRYYGVGGFCKPKVEAHDDSDNSSDVDMNVAHIPQPKQPTNNVGVCADPSSDSSSEVDMNSAHIPHPKQPTTNVHFCADPYSTNSSDVDMNSAHIPQPKQPTTNVHIPKFSYDQSSDSFSDPHVAKSAFQNHHNNNGCQQS